MPTISCPLTAAGPIVLSAVFPKIILPPFTVKLVPTVVVVVDTKVPPVTAAVDVIVLPVEIVPKPEAIEPDANAPTVVAAVVTKLGIAVISSSKYAANV